MSEKNFLLRVSTLVDLIGLLVQGKRRSIVKTNVRLHYTTVSFLLHVALHSFRISSDVRTSVDQFLRLAAGVLLHRSRVLVPE